MVVCFFHLLEIFKKPEALFMGISSLFLFIFISVAMAFLGLLDPYIIFALGKWVFMCVTVMVFAFLIFIYAFFRNKIIKF